MPDGVPADCAGTPWASWAVLAVLRPLKNYAQALRL